MAITPAPSMVESLLSPVVLFFLLGFGAGIARSDLSFPEAFAKGISLYLMLAIGFKGGTEVAHAGFQWAVLGTAAVGIGAGFGLPFVAYALLRNLTSLGRIDAAAIAAHYGSISVVTFVAGTDYLTRLAIPYDGFMIAIVALMESPAIIAGLLLARRGDETSTVTRSHFLREALLNGSVVLLIGSFAIGLVTGEKGAAQLAPFIATPFKGVLCLFLLDMGLVAARRLRGSAHMNMRLFAFGLSMPLVGAVVGLLGAAAAGLSEGSATLLVILCASASYIAVPAAMRVALPKANPAYSLTLSLGVTFPFNLTVGIPLYATATHHLLT
ncbi:MAG: sodium-dependent bicarbonate transport family permease [Myxococcota bacterium]